MLSLRVFTRNKLGFISGSYCTTNTPNEKGPTESKSESNPKKPSVNPQEIKIRSSLNAIQETLRLKALYGIKDAPVKKVVANDVLLFKMADWRNYLIGANSVLSVLAVCISFPTNLIRSSLSTPTASL
jgi:hypothetical protein